jgi:hypothetical protein
MIDETLLDAPEALARADLRGMLRSVAAAGAQVRTAVRATMESPLTELHSEGRPGSVLLAGPGSDIPLAAGLLAALTDGAVRVQRLPAAGPLAAPGALRWPLPRWAGPLDLLVITTTDGSEPGLSDLLERAYRRGCAVVSIAPSNSSLAELTERRRSLSLRLTSAPFVEPAAHPAAPGPQWSLVTPLLMLGDRLGICTAGDAELHALADRLDEVAERCGPVSRTHGNPAKALAGGFDEALPLLWSEGPIAGAAARHAADTLATLPGVPALSAELPEALSAHGALLNGGPANGAAADPEDFFRDRVDDPPVLHARVVLLRSPLAESTADEDGNRPSAAAAARDLAVQQGVAFTELAADEDSSPLEAAGELIAQLDFAAVYLALTSGVRS